MPRWPVVLVAAVVLAGCTAAPPAAGPATVRAIGGGTANVFEPTRVAVPPGGAVRWSDESGSHTVTFERDVSGNGTAPDSGNLDPGQAYTLAFPRPGTWRYRCIYHSFGFEPGQGMVGAVVAG